MGAPLGALVQHRGPSQRLALRHSTSAQRHHGQAGALLAQHERLYTAAREQHPERWSGDTRNWHLDDAGYLNPERLNVIEAKAP